MHKRAKGPENDFAVLFLHGSSFPSELSFAYKMSGSSWMDDLSEKGYEVYALDFLGYGNSDRYLEMTDGNTTGEGLGRAIEVYHDVDRAVNFVLKATGKSKVHLIGHSWGGSVAALYSSLYPEKIAKLVLYASIAERQSQGNNVLQEKPYEELTPERRVEMMRSLTPVEEDCQLEPEILNGWGAAWLASDGLSAKLNPGRVRFPAGYRKDVFDLLNGRSYYDARTIHVPTLVIRGAWDTYPDAADGEGLYRALAAAEKEYVVIERGTHVLHLEKQRHKLYHEVHRFLQSGNGGTK